MPLAEMPEARRHHSASGIDAIIVRAYVLVVVPHIFGSVRPQHFAETV